MSYKHTFTESESGKSFTLKVTTLDSLTDSILINVREKIPVKPSGNAGAFPQGTASDSFVLICNLNQSYREALNVDSLNDYAYNYLEALGETVDRSTKYYSKDADGIYVYIEKQDRMQYDNDTTEINGKTCYKVYLGGTADIIGFQRHGSDTGKYQLQLSNGFYKAIANKLYLFVSDSARLAYVITSGSKAISFHYNGETTANQKVFTDDSVYKEGGYYISIGNDCSIKTIKSPDTSSGVNYVFRDGDIDAIITSNTMTKLEHFADIVNANKIVLSTNIKEIGDYCFYGSLISGTVELETSVLEEIGSYAFANMSNLNLLNINATSDGFSHMPASLKKIGDYAFQNSAGLKKISFLNCSRLQSVGNEAFGNCGNLRNVRYLQKQVEPDKITSTQLLYLPPEQGSDGNYVPRIKTSSPRLVTASYGYDYEAASAYPNITEEEKEKTTRTFINCSNISWDCQ